MTTNILVKIFHVLFVLLACAVLWSYFSYKSPRKIEYATPRRDKSENRVVKQKTVKIGENFTRFHPDSILRPFSGVWPCFRGEKRDNLVEDTIPLSKKWGKNGPRVLWRKALGEGYAAAIIVNERVYVLDYIESQSSNGQEQEGDALRCFSIHTGEELWRRGYENPLRRNHGKSRTIPAYADNVVVTFGPTAQVMAVDATSGDLLWSLDVVRKYGSEVPQWYAGQCPLIDKGKVILGVGGEHVLMTALDLKSGKTIWELPNEHKLKMSHASVLPTNLCGTRQYVYAGIGGIAGCDEHGKLLWECSKWKPAVWAPTPVNIGHDKLFLTAGYGAGSALLSIKKRNGVFEANVEEEWKPTKGPASEQQTPLVIGETLFVIQPKDAGGLRGQMVAAEIEKLPAIKVSSGRQARFGLGPYIHVDDAFWIADDEGVLHVYAYKNGKFEFISRHKVLPGVDSWGPIAYANGVMIVRDSTSMVCLDLGKKTESSLISKKDR